MMLVTNLCWRQRFVGDSLKKFQTNHYVGDFSVKSIGHQYLEVVTNMNRLQHPSLTSMWQ